MLFEVRRTLAYSFTSKVFLMFIQMNVAPTTFFYKNRITNVTAMSRLVLVPVLSPLTDNKHK